MKKIALLSTAAVLFASLTTYAQPKKGDWMVGANIANTMAATSSWGTQFSVNLNPSAGYFLSNRVAVGTGVGLSYQHFDKNFSSFNTSLMPFARYYFAKKEGMQAQKLYLFGEVSAGVGAGTSSYINNIGIKRKVSGGTFQSSAGLGLTYFILPSVSIEGAFRFNYNKPFPPRYGVSNQVIPSLSLGFQIYLPGKKRKNTEE